MKHTTTCIFGFGSLINTASLRRTAPHAANIRPVYIKGFHREFNLWDSVSGWSHNDLDSIPYCALDVRKDEDTDSKINGVLFEVPEEELAKLKKREYLYKLVDTVAYDFATGKPIGECWVFSACKNDGKYDFDSPTQVRYAEICLKGAREYGEAFYQMFLDTTFIGSMRLSDMPELIHELVKD